MVAAQAVHQPGCRPGCCRARSMSQDPDLVFLRIQRIPPCPAPAAASQHLEAVVDAVVAPERGSPQGTSRVRNPGRPAVLEKHRVDVGRGGKEVRPHEFGGSLPVVNSVRYSVDLGLLVAPGEIGIGLREPHLGQPLHHLGPGEGLGEKDRVRDAWARAPARSPIPRTETAWCADCRRGTSSPRAPHQNRNISRIAVPDARDRIAVEVEVDDVLVFLRRVLGVFDRCRRAASRTTRDAP